MFYLAGCSMTKERGTCRNYTVKWFFDMQYGGCSRFWYGGCDGNANRYKSKEECEQICVNPVESGLPKYIHNKTYFTILFNF